MHELSSSESELITIAQNWANYELAPGKSKKKIPEKISFSAQKILEDSLTKSILFWLMENGAWQNRVFFSNENPVRSPVWGRYPSLPLKFGKTSFRMIRDRRDRPEKTFKYKEEDKIEIGEEILLSMYPSLKYKSLSQTSPLCWLLRFTDLISEETEHAIPNFDNLVSNHSWLLEAITPLLAKTWYNIECSKNNIKKPRQMVLLGKTQEKVISTFLNTLEAHNRKDLSCFLVEAAARLLNLRTKQYPKSKFWIESLDLTNQSLDQRQTCFQQAGAFLKSLARIQEWAKEESMIPHWEENYKKAQGLLNIWRPLNIRPNDIKDNLSGFERAATLYKDLVEVV